MGEISTKANEVYRDRDGSSPHYPEKPAIRSLFQLVDASVADVGAIIQAAQEADGDAAVAGAIAGQAAGEEVAQEIANGKADVDLGNATFEWDGSGAVVSTPYNKLTQVRDLTDFIDPSQYAAIRNFAPTEYATNSLGQDSFAAALADMNIDQGGEIRLPDGTVRLQPQTISRPHTHIIGRGSCSVIHSFSTTADAFNYTAPFTVTAGLQVISIFPRTAGAIFRARNEATRFYLEDIESHSAFRLLQIDGHVSDPSLDSGIFTGRNLRSYETVVGGEAFYINGGYDVSLDDIKQIGDNDAQALTGLHVIRCADLRVTKAQLLNVERPLLINPPTGMVAASAKFQNVYMGTSLKGSLISDAAGGSIVSLKMFDCWAGETEETGANGLSIYGTNGRVKGAELVAMEFPLAMGNGLDVNGVIGFQMTGGQADGCGSTGMAFQNMTDAIIEGVKSGAYRFGGNVNGIYEAGNTRLTLRGNAHGNTGTNFINGSGTSSDIRVVV